MPNRASTGPILLVEDCAEDYESFIRALNTLGLHNPVYRFSHGEAAMDYLNHRGRFFLPDSAPRPDMVVLDLNLPEMQGLEVVRAIRRDPALCTIPVIILSGSATPAEMPGCLAAGADAFIRKPSQSLELAEILRATIGIWLAAESAFCSPHPPHRTPASIRLSPDAGRGPKVRPVPGLLELQIA